jgi:hypothetical protein
MGVDFLVPNEVINDDADWATDHTVDCTAFSIEVYYTAAKTQRARSGMGMYWGRRRSFQRIFA